VAGVLFGADSAAPQAGLVTSGGETTWTVVVPPYAFSGKLALTFADRDPLLSVQSFTVTPVVTAKPPVLANVAPLTGVPGTQVTLTGQYLSGASVTFNGTPAQVTKNTDVLITTPAPAGGTTGPVTVKTSGGEASSAQPFVYVGDTAPSVSGFSPETGGPETEVVIAGKNLGGTTAVWVDDHIGNTWPVQEILSVAANEVRVLVGDGPECGSFVVKTPEGTAESYWPWVPDPVIQDFNPKAGPKATYVGVVGKHLCDIPKAAVGGGDVAVYGGTVLYESLGIVISAEAKTGKIAVTNSHGVTAESAGVFTVTLDP
jgi:hypothetical protein